MIAWRKTLGIATQHIIVTYMVNCLQHHSPTSRSCSPGQRSPPWLLFLTLLCWPLHLVGKYCSLHYAIMPSLFLSLFNSTLYVCVCNSQDSMLLYLSSTTAQSLFSESYYLLYHRNSKHVKFMWAIQCTLNASKSWTKGMVPAVSGKRGMSTNEAANKFAFIVTTGLQIVTKSLHSLAILNLLFHCCVLLLSSEV